MSRDSERRGAEHPQHMWGVKFVYDNARLDEDEKRLRNLRTRLPEAVISSVPPTGLNVRFPVVETSPERAFQRAIAQVQGAVIASGLGRSLPTRIETDLLEGADLTVQENDMPDLIGVAELAHLLGISKQRASEIAGSGDFPPPAAVLASGPVWNKMAVAKYATRSRRPGRPPRLETVGQRLRRYLAEDAAMHSHTVSEDSQDRVFLWVCVPGPRGVTYVLSKSQAESLIAHFFDPGIEWRSSFGKSERERRPAGNDITSFVELQRWERRDGFYKGIEPG